MGRGGKRAYEPPEIKRQADQRALLCMPETKELSEPFPMDAAVRRPKRRGFQTVEGSFTGKIPGSTEGEFLWLSVNNGQSYAHVEVAYGTRGEVEQRRFFQ
jgi:hypothetical protein